MREEYGRERGGRWGNFEREREGGRGRDGERNREKYIGKER